MLISHVSCENSPIDLATHNVYLRSYLAWESRGENFKLPTDDFDPKEKGQWIGEISEESPGLFVAKVHTSAQESGHRFGYMETIDRLFSSIDDAREAVATEYDAATDNLVASKCAD